MINSVDKSAINMVMNNAKTQKTQETQKAQETGAIKTGSTELKPQETAGQNIDTLELSTQAQSYLDEINSETGSAEEAETTETSGSAVTAAADTSSESVNVNELYSYTESELKDLLTSGEITQIEYDNEMASRGITT